LETGPIGQSRRTPERHDSSCDSKVLRERGPDGERTVFGFARDLLKHARAGNAVFAQMVLDEPDGPLPKPSESPSVTQQAVIVLPEWAGAARHMLETWKEP
jgi:hypothetical protein